MRRLQILLVSLLVTGAALLASSMNADAQVQDVPARKAIITSFDARDICPGVCTAAGARQWTGNFVRNLSRTAMCECAFGRVSGGGNSYNGTLPGWGNRPGNPGGRHPGYGNNRGPAVKRIQAGPIFSNTQAQSICPSLCRSDGRRWAGAWQTTQPGRMSVCDCVR